MDKNEAKKIAGKHYHVDMREKEDQLSKGLSLTHEQVNDNYMEGTIDAVVKNAKR